MKSSKSIKAYVDWLKHEVGFEQVNGCTFDRVIEALFNTPYPLFDDIPFENNIVVNALQLRVEFFGDKEPKDLVHQPPSNLEVMVDLARRYYRFIGEFSPYVYFVDMLCETDLLMYDDANFEYNVHNVLEIIDRISYRTYDALGYGGLFPIKNPQGLPDCTYDARTTDLWKQMNTYWLALERSKNNG